MMMMMNLVS